VNRWREDANPYVSCKGNYFPTCGNGRRFAPFGSTTLV
jgi:hypothetical protein